MISFNGNNSEIFLIFNYLGKFLKGTECIIHGYNEECPCQPRKIINNYQDIVVSTPNFVLVKNDKIKIFYFWV